MYKFTDESNKMKRESVCSKPQTEVDRFTGLVLMRDKALK